MVIRPATRISGNVSVPGDKSISHRAAIIASLAEGASLLQNYSTSQDCAATLNCLRKLGVPVEQAGNEVRIGGRGTKGLAQPSAPLDCGNSGSTMRMLAGVLATQEFESVLTGDDSLRRRPMNRIVDPLRLMGATVSGDDGRPPLRISGSTRLKAIRYELPVASAQVKSCILLAALNATGRTEVIETRGSTRDHTERMLQWFGVSVTTASGREISLDGPVHFRGRDVFIPGDISSAAFLIAAAALVPNSDLLIEGVGLNPTRTRVLTLLQSLGVSIEVNNEREISNEPIGSIRIRGGDIAASSRNRVRLEGSLITDLIDELPLLAVVGSQLPSGLEIREARELRFKETDRIAATVLNLRAMGAEVDEFDDGLAVAGPTRLRGAKLQSLGDHRIAMAFAIAACIADGESELDDAACVNVSFPEFFELFDSVVER
ncbi:MAG TPA: 3-phosphoshikimate 1-carboxyvinyltransferase [Pyrinomonadaceae bacterium]|nr:3-phosphoshikimate 1-carboxyvinyltransferase [Pyrinomonadaceae bacterium]